jgi:hypothetical protein
MLRLWGLVIALVVSACASSSSDNKDQPDAAPTDCMVEGAHQCAGSSSQVCRDKLWTTEMDCTVACDNMLGCVECSPGGSFCKDGNVWSCDASGQLGMELQACAGANTCSGGGCVDACADAAQNKSYIGCEYWAVDLDNAVEVLGQAPPNGATCAQLFGQGTVKTLAVCFRSQGINQFYAGTCDPPNGACPSGYACETRPACVLDAQSSPFAIVVSNPQTREVNVAVTGPQGTVLNRTVAAGQVAAIMPQPGIPDQSVDESVLQKRAYKVTSDLPIVAYQFNPLDNVNVFSNDASLLIPRAAFDTQYYVMSWPTLDRRANPPGRNRYHGYFSVVAAEATEIQVTPSVAVQSSATQQTIAAGATTTFTLAAHDVLQLQAAGAGDLTGTEIRSTNMATFGVFGGHEAASFGEAMAPDGVHTSGPCCADHLEEMLFPTSTWGKTFAIARSQPRTNERDVLRVMAQKPNTTVTFTPAPSMGTCGTLQPGQFCEVRIAGDTAIAASEPILVGHLLQSSIWQRPNGQQDVIGSGDPSLAIAVPTEQYRKEYTILVPQAYQMNHLSISTGTTGGVFIDGNAVTLAAFGGMYRGARVPIAAGQHKITCADGCGILVYGYSDAVSYMFAGGLDLKPIVIF